MEFLPLGEINTFEHILMGIFRFSIVYLCILNRYFTFFEYQTPDLKTHLSMLKQRPSVLHAQSRVCGIRASKPVWLTGSTVVDVDLEFLCLNASMICCLCT